MRKKIAVVTGSRAEYGLLRPVILGLMARPEVEVMLIATGTHLAPEFGMTIREIEADGIPVKDRIEIILSSDSPVGVGKSIGLALIGLVEAFSRNLPDLVLLLGDRFEIFAAAAAATVSRVPIAHIHGGELTLGAIDDAFRHSITKMSLFHFPATEGYRQRIIQLGESPDRVFSVGALGVESALAIEPLSRDRLEDDLGVNLGHQVFLVTFHPATLDFQEPARQLDELLAALDAFPEATVVFTKANADMDGRSINKRLDEYVQSWVGRRVVVQSLGHLRYISLMRSCDVVIGNSSSGLIEAPSLGVPTVNIGNRQKGRDHGDSVLDALVDRQAIGEAIKLALKMGHSGDVNGYPNPYKGESTAIAIVRTLVDLLAKPIPAKEFCTIRNREC